MISAEATPMTIASTQATLTRYFEGHDVTALAHNAVFTIMGTGQQHHGREAVQGMLTYFYRVAFQADVETTNLVVAPGQAVLEAFFVGTHTGEFAGVPPTGKQVRVPLCIVYDLARDQIVRGRVYFETPVFLQQVGAT
ncbi:MAG TPA: ester cyclase [Chloroflexia bacterium]|nr:ester cyclase [Chloroflexia bacterium]